MRSFLFEVKILGLIYSLALSFIFITANQEIVAQTFTYSQPGSFSFTVPNYTGAPLGANESLSIDIDVIIVGAGGAGGTGRGAGGGGGGEILTEIITVNQGDVLTGYIGAGGIATSEDGGVGESTVFEGLIARGGLGGRGGESGEGGNSGNGNLGGDAGTPNGNGQNQLRAGGGGAGYLEAGQPGNTQNNGQTRGGNGGEGDSNLNAGGGGGGTAARNGNENNILGIGIHGGTSGSLNTAADAINGGGGGGGRARGGKGGDGLVIISVSFTILPIEILNFETRLEKNNKNVILEWTTAKELNSSHFEIERALNGIENWEKIGTINSVGYSDQMTSYSYLDEKLPITGGRLFYRLKSVDLDGKYTYSKTLAIQVAPVSGNSTWRLYPNPSETGTYVHLVQLENHIGQDQAISFKISDSSGISAGDFIANSLEQVESQLNEYLKNQKAGLYFLHLSSEAYSENIKIFVR